MKKARKKILLIPSFVRSNNNACAQMKSQKKSNKFLHIIDSNHGPATIQHPEEREYSHRQHTLRGSHQWWRLSTGDQVTPCTHPTSTCCRRRKVRSKGYISFHHQKHQLLGHANQSHKLRQMSLAWLIIYMTTYESNKLYILGETI